MYASFVLFYADFAAVNMLALVLSSQENGWDPSGV